MKNIFKAGIILLSLILIGCSSGNQDPITDTGNTSALLTLPDFPIEEPVTPESGRIFSGVWSMNLDAESMTASVVPERSLLAHYKVSNFLPTAAIQVIRYDSLTGIIDVDVTIFNNTLINVYDLRLIIYTDNLGIRLTNWDNWTALFDATGGASINPFRAYAKHVQNRKFAGYTQHTERLQFYLPGGSGSIYYGIDASYPSNCDEPYSIRNFNQEILYDTANSSATVSIEVYDWQDDNDIVGLYCPQITGGGWESFTKVSANEWELNLVNRAGAGEGEYLGVIKSNDPSSVFLYELVHISVSEDPTPEWTIMVYMHESDLHTFDVEDINEMERVGSVDNKLEIIVLWDRTFETDVILRIERDNDTSTVTSPTIDDNGEVIPPGGLDMGDQKTVEDFLRWSFKNYPAKNYGLIFWDHGDGPFGIVPESVISKSCCGGLSVWEIRDGCQTVLNEFPEISKLEFIGFDCCLMSWLETAYCIKDVCNAVIASEMLEPATGWQYNTPLQYLANNISSCTTDELCRQFAMAYLNSVGSGNTIATWRCNNISSSVIPALNNFADELTNALPDNRVQIHDDWDSSDSWGSNCSRPYIKDLGYFASIIGNNPDLPVSLRNTAQTLVTSIESAMIYHAHTCSGSGCCADETGWQIWFPDDYNDSWWSAERSDYQSLGFSATRWDEFLDAFDA